MLIKKLACVVALSTALTACQQHGGPFTSQGVGTVAGGVTGAVIGSQFGGGSGRIIATAAGTLIGSVIGADIGRSLDRVDRQYNSNATYQALESAPTGKPISWNNPDTGHYGSTQVIKTYGDTQCREYVTKIYVDGRERRAYGTACRQPDGSWKIKN